MENLRLKIRCICGRVVTVTGDERKTCACGRSVWSEDTSGGKVRAMVADDGQPGRKANRPAIVKMEWREE